MSEYSWLVPILITYVPIVLGGLAVIYLIVVAIRIVSGKPDDDKEHKVAEGIGKVFFGILYAGFLAALAYGGYVILTWLKRGS